MAYLAAHFAAQAAAECRAAAEAAGQPHYDASARRSREERASPDGEGAFPRDGMVPGWLYPLDGTVRFNRTSFVISQMQDRISLRPDACRCRFRALLLLWRLMRYLLTSQRPEAGEPPERYARHYPGDIVRDSLRCFYFEAPHRFCSRACRHLMARYLNAFFRCFVPRGHTYSYDRDLFRFSTFLDLLPDFEGRNGAGRLEAGLCQAGAVALL